MAREAANRGHCRKSWSPTRRRIPTGKRRARDYFRRIFRNAAIRRFAAALPFTSLRELARFAVARLVRRLAVVRAVLAFARFAARRRRLPPFFGMPHSTSCAAWVC